MTVFTRNSYFESPDALSWTYHFTRQINGAGIVVGTGNDRVEVYSAVVGASPPASFSASITDEGTDGQIGIIAAFRNAELLSVAVGSAEVLDEHAIPTVTVQEGGVLVAVNGTTYSTSATTTGPAEMTEIDTQYNDAADVGCAMYYEVMTADGDSPERIFSDIWDYDAQVSYSLAPASGAPKIPTAGLVVHLDAANRGTTDNQWDDLSGNDNHWTSAAGQFPTFADGAATFNGSSEYLTGPDLSALTEGEVFILQKRYADNNDTGNNTGWTHLGNGAGDQDGFTYASGVYCEIGRQDRISLGNPTQDTSLYHVINVRSGTTAGDSGNPWEMYWDGVDFAGVGTNTVRFPAAPFIGKSHGFLYFQGSIKALLIYNRRLTTEERAVVNTYLAPL
jgi:hypothetical protein